MSVQVPITTLTGKPSSVASAREAFSSGADLDVPLCVDLDGTLVRTDLLFESLMSALKDQPSLAFRIPVWLLKGRAHLKQQLSERASIDASLLPYHEEFLDWLKSEKQRGRKIYLVTAADSKLADQISDFLGIFEEVLASDGDTNLKGKWKSNRLVERFGKGCFDYAGDSSADLSVWPNGRKTIVVAASKKVRRQIDVLEDDLIEFGGRANTAKEFLRSIRCYQWVKNVLVFVPVITSHTYTSLPVMISGAMIFVAWCLVASGIYLSNDLLDLEADRAHHRKRNRPFASGALKISIGIVATPVLIIAGLGLALAISWQTAGMLALYVIVSQAYSLHLKRRLLIDVFILAFLYTARVVGGGLATGNHATIWLLGFSCFMFLGLAFLKRCAELIRIRDAGKQHLGNRGYGIGDLDMLERFGVSSSFASVLVLSLYVHSNVAVDAYARPSALWAIVPLLLFWQCRLWIATSRGEMHDDPIVFSIKDRVSWALGACTAAAFVASVLLS
jgi:4-hydroxybenzoate polyprenyltransferase/phosphoserine phosphatase